MCHSSSCYTSWSAQWAAHPGLVSEQLQLKLLKMGGRLVHHARRLVFQLAEAAVPRSLFQSFPGRLERIAGLSPAPG